MVQFKAFRNQAKSFHSVNYVNINYSINYANVHCKVNLVQKACTICFADHMLEFEILQTI
mgnify:FL=1